MGVKTMEHTKIRAQRPQVLLKFMNMCRRSWEDYVQRKHNGLTPQMRLQLLQEFHSMKDVVEHLIPEELYIDRHPGLTRQTVEKAFGEDAWAVLNRGLVYLGAFESQGVHASSQTSGASDDSETHEP